MRKKTDVLIIYIGFFMDIFLMIFLKYFQRLLFLQLVIKTIDNYNIYNKCVSLFFTYTYILLFCLLAVIYIILIYRKYKKHIYIDIKRNNTVLIVLLICDLTLNLFNFKTIISYSYAFRFVVICLLTNLVVYIKYKKNNIKIK